MPKVPHAVPVENDSRHATTNISIGRIPIGTPEFSTREATYGPVERRSLHTPLIVHASVRITHAATIEFTPGFIHEKKSLKVRTFLHM